MLAVTDDQLRARQYLTRADEIRALAERVSDASTRECLLQMAMAYRRAAGRVQRHEGVRVEPTFGTIVAEEASRPR